MTSEHAEQADEEPVRLRLDLAYDGTAFAGWARQPGLRTVQGLLEEALATVLRTSAHGVAGPHVTVAGRTDAGVHARGQVAHVDVPPSVLDAARGRTGTTSPAGRPGRTAGPGRTATDALVARLAGVLPPDLVVHRVTLAQVGFDARFSALRRRYAYRICDDPATRDPLTRTAVLWHRRPLDVAAMDEAARRLLGRHDFAAYCKPREGATTIRTLEELGWTRATDGPDAGLVVARVQADAFCHSMVRSLVGASLAVGEGRRPVTWLAELLVARRRDAAAHVVAAHGLTLEEVGYPSDDELAARAAQTRARRAAHDVDPAPVPAATGPAAGCGCG